VIRCLDRKMWGAAMTWRQGQSYSEDLRGRVLAAVDGGMAARAAAKLFRVSVSYIDKALIRRRRTGEVSASTRRGHRPRKLSSVQEVALAEHITAYPDLTLAALQAWLLAEHGVRVSNGAVWSAVARLGLSFKKRMARPVRKRLVRGDLTGLRQRIRSRGVLPRPRWRSARPGPHKSHGVDAPSFEPGFRSAGSTVRPSRFHHSQTS
jgi:transposase